MTVYALSEVPKLDADPGEVTRDKMLTAIKGIILDSVELNVKYTRP